MAPVGPRFYHHLPEPPEDDDIAFMSGIWTHHKDTNDIGPAESRRNSESSDGSLSWSGASDDDELATGCPLEPGETEILSPHSEAWSKFALHHRVVDSNMSDKLKSLPTQTSYGLDQSIHSLPPANGRARARSSPSPYGQGGRLNCHVDAHGSTAVCATAGTASVSVVRQRSRGVSLSLDAHSLVSTPRFGTGIATRHWQRDMVKDMRKFACDITASFLRSESLSVSQCLGHHHDRGSESVDALPTVRGFVQKRPSRMTGATGVSAVSWNRITDVSEEETGVSADCIDCDDVTSYRPETPARPVSVPEDMSANRAGTSTSIAEGLLCQGTLSNHCPVISAGCDAASTRSPSTVSNSKGKQSTITQTGEINAFAQAMGTGYSLANPARSSEDNGGVRVGEAQPSSIPTKFDATCLKCLLKYGDITGLFVCEEVKKDITALIKHLREKHNAWVCTTCWKVFNSKEVLRQHKQDEPGGQQLCLNPDCEYWNKPQLGRCTCNSNGRSQEKYCKLFETVFPGRGLPPEDLAKRDAERQFFRDSPQGRRGNTSSAASLQGGSRPGACVSSVPADVHISCKAYIDGAAASQGRHIHVFSSLDQESLQEDNDTSMLAPYDAPDPMEGLEQDLEDLSSFKIEATGQPLSDTITPMMLWQDPTPSYGLGKFEPRPLPLTAPGHSQESSFYSQLTPVFSRQQESNGNSSNTSFRGPGSYRSEEHGLGSEARSSALRNENEALRQQLEASNSKLEELRSGLFALMRKDVGPVGSDCVVTMRQRGS